MKKILAMAVALLTMTTNVLALEGEMGYFGGITPGTKIPTGIALAQEKYQLDKKYVLPYKENVYLSGSAATVEGTLEIRPGEIDLSKAHTGSYKEVYIMKAVSDDASTEISRSITLETQYVYNEVRDQLTKTSTVSQWTETVVASGQTYRLDSSKSSFSKSILEDFTPGVKYYNGDVYYKAVYANASGGADVTVNVDGRIYGYDQAFAKSETQVRNVTVDTGTRQYFIQETPTITMSKEISYGSNEPQAISFAGNYRELIQGEGVLAYNMMVSGATVPADSQYGAVAVSDTPTIEQLTLPSLTQLDGHPAKSDIQKMYSMDLFDVNPIAFSPNQVVTRGEYITMLVKAFRIPLRVEDTKKKTDVVEEVIFTDVDTTSAVYPYLVAAYDAGLIAAGEANPNGFLNREQMIVFNVRALGLERLGLGIGLIQTPYMDDNKISSYAKSSIYAASKLGIIPTVNGYIFPQQHVTYAECATFMNILIDYLRYDLQKDYNQHMMM
ncbi:MAG: hypothetical protein BEN19_03205 [Epulopiscium sp. Nuni2H_MBin003]|nr:MAG: hypothetical protein BEN19_03205 [Epulopiscium sp. Nuni2H_MBin003]